MKNLLTNYRYYLLMLLAVIAVAGAFSIPADHLDTFTWMAVFVATRLAAVLAATAFVRLYRRWDKGNRLSELRKWVADE